MKKETIKPTELTYKSGTAIEVKSQYDWKNQRLEIEGCKFGTNNSTSSTTSSRGYAGMLCTDDNNSDSIQD